MKHIPSGESGKAIERAEQTRVEQAVQQAVSDLEKRKGEVDVKGRSLDRAEMSPEQREAYRQFYEMTNKLFENHDVGRHNGIEIVQLVLPADHPSERSPLISVARKHDTPFSEIPKDVPISEWGDYIFNFGSGKKAEPNAHVGLIEAGLPFRADYDFNPDGSVSRSLFDIDSGELTDFQRFAPIGDIESLNTSLPDCVDVNWGSAGGGIGGGIEGVGGMGGSSGIAAPE